MRRSLKLKTSEEKKNLPNSRDKLSPIGSTIFTPYKNDLEDKTEPLSPTSDPTITKSSADVKKSLAEKVFRCFTPYTIFTYIFLRFPLQGSVTPTGFVFHYNRKSIPAIGYTITSIIVAIIAFLFGINTVGWFLDFPSIHPNRPNDSNLLIRKGDYRFEEQYIVRRNIVPLIVLISSLCHSTVGSWQLYKMRHFAASYFTFWTEVVEIISIDVAHGVRRYMSIIMISYGAFLVIFFVACAIGFAPVSRGGPALLAMLTVRFFYPAIHTVKKFWIFRGFGGFLFFYIMICSKTFVLLFVLICRLLRNAFLVWNMRLERVLLGGEDKPKDSEKISKDKSKDPEKTTEDMSKDSEKITEDKSKNSEKITDDKSKDPEKITEDKSKNSEKITDDKSKDPEKITKDKSKEKITEDKQRTEFALLFKDHVCMLDLLEGADTLFANIIESFYVSQVCSIIFEVYYFYRSQSSEDFTNARRLDGVIIILYLMQSLAILVVVSLAAAEVGEVAMEGLEVIRRRGMMGTMSDDELYFIMSMYTSYTGHFETALHGGGYFTLDKGFLVAIVGTVFSYFIILLQFSPSLIITTSIDPRVEHYNTSLVIKQVEGTRQLFNRLKVGYLQFSANLTDVVTGMHSTDVDDYFLDV